MSFTELSNTLKNHLGKAIKNNLDIGILKNVSGLIGSSTKDVKGLRNKLKAAEFNNIVLTKEGFKSLLAEIQVSTEAITFEQYSDYMSYRKSGGPSTKSIDEFEFRYSSMESTSEQIKSSSIPGIKDPWTIIYNTPYSSLRKWTGEFLEISGYSKQAVDDCLGKFEAGHIIGIASYRSLISFGSNIDEESGRVVIRGEPDLAYFDRINQLLIDLDLASANSLQTDTGIYAGATKNLGNQTLNPSMYIEFQALVNEQGTGNQQTGSILGPVTKALAAIASAQKSGSGVSIELKTLGENLKLLEVQAKELISKYPEAIKDAATKNLDALLEAKGSDSLKDYSVKVIINALEGIKPPKGEDTKYPKVKIATIPTSNKLLMDEIKAIAKELQIKNKKVKEQLKKAKAASSRVRNLKGHFFSLAALQVILNQQLADRIKANMGTGTATKVLNYRSGRFADTVKVERMSSSREGMITAFYTYMKYPYQTFEPGYKQGSPASRNPRLLISQSIREIAATVVKNRLRAVLI
jgi:hypothetical protein